MNTKVFYPIFVLILSSFIAFSQAEKSEMNSIYDIKINSLMGDEINLGDFQGKKIMFVNVASKCGFTPQYTDLQKFHEKYGKKVVLIGVPCNQFMNQEPGTAKEIQEFCEKNYGVTFLMTEKIDVKGDNQHPLYQWLTQKKYNKLKDSGVKWNFQKYLIDEKGELIDFFYSPIKPLDEKITSLL